MSDRSAFDRDVWSTEQSNPNSRNLGALDPEQVISLMAQEDRVILPALHDVTRELALAARQVATAFLSGHRTIFLGTGTSGRIAIQEVSELPATFGVPAEQFVAYVASRAPVGPAAVAVTEDDTEAVCHALSAIAVGSGDVVIGLAASGRTPFVLAGIQFADRAGAFTCGISNSPGTPLAQQSQLGIVIDTGPEVLTGSTRLKAGTSQKIALNRITTAAMIAAGRVTDNYMTSMRATNGKLRDRAVRIVSELKGVTEQEAHRLLEEADWKVQDALR